MQISSSTPESWAELSTFTSSLEYASGAKPKHVASKRLIFLKNGLYLLTFHPESLFDVSFIIIINFYVPFQGDSE